MKFSSVIVYGDTTDYINELGFDSRACESLVCFSMLN